MKENKIISTLSLFILLLGGMSLYDYVLNDFSKAFAKGYAGEKSYPHNTKTDNQPYSYLTRICEDSICELGTPSGYTNIYGDTLIPIGRYRYCYTDTIKTFGIVLDSIGAKAIDVKGKELYQVYWFDNGPDYLSEGLFRVVINGKIGYANEEGKVVIFPKYECAEQFINEKARVTEKCELIPHGEHKYMQSDTWVFIDKVGQVLK